MSSIADIFGGNNNPPPCPECAKRGRPVTFVQYYVLFDIPEGYNSIRYTCTDCGHEWSYKEPRADQRKDNENGQS